LTTGYFDSRAQVPAATPHGSGLPATVPILPGRDTPARQPTPVKLKNEVSKLKEAFTCEA